MAQKEIVLITGGTGFAGSHLAELLSLEPERYELHLTHVTAVPDSLRHLLPNAQFHELDLTKTTPVRSLTEQLKPTQIYQLASIPVVGDSFERAEEIFTANTAVIHALLEAVRAVVPTSRVLVVTSAEVYGQSLSEQELPINELHPFRPMNPYAVSKVTQDVLSLCYQRTYDLQIVVARPFNHIGERQSPGFAVSDFAKQIVAIERGTAQTLLVGNLTTARDFSDVKDVVRAYRLLMEQGQVGEAYNIGSGIAVPMQEVLDQLIALASSPIAVQTDAARVRPADIPVMQADTTKLQALGWQPEISLSDSLERIMKYWRSL